MKLNELTVRNYGRYQALLVALDDEQFAPLVRAAAMVMAARDAGIADGLPEALATGDLFAMKPTDSLRGLIIDAAVAIGQHIAAELEPVTGE